MGKTKIYSTRSFSKGRSRWRARSGESGPQKASGVRGQGRLLEILLVACAALAILVALDAYANSGEVYRGVEVAGVPVGGETPEEARKIVQNQLQSNMPQEFRLIRAGESVALNAAPDAGESGGLAADLQLVSSDQVAVLNSEELAIDFNVESTVDRAYEVGRSGWVGHRVAERFRASMGMVGVDASAEFDADLVRNVVGGLANEVNQAPQNAAISLSGTEAQVQKGRPGFELAQGATVDNVRQAIGNLEGEAKVAGGPAEPKITTGEANDAADRINGALEEPLTLEAGDQSWSLDPEQVSQLLAVSEDDSGVNLRVNAEQFQVLLPDMYESLQSAPKDAEFKFVDDTVEVEPAQPGKQVAQDKLAEEVNSGLFDGRHAFKVPLKDGGQPELTTEKAEDLKPTELLGEFSTNYKMVDDPDGNRTYNLNIAAEAIDQTLLAPGEVFSVNDKVAQLDYKEAKVFQEGLIQYAEGGGLCQVASTLYVAAVRSGLEIVERHQHYAMLEYIKPGFDSTVWFGDAYGNGELDSRFKNSTDSYVLLREWVDEDGHMYAEVWGQPTDTKAELRSERVNYDNSTSTWVTYKKVKKNGEVVDEEKAYTDTYRSVGDNENYDQNDLFNPDWEP